MSDQDQKVRENSMDLLIASRRLPPRTVFKDSTTVSVSQLSVLFSTEPPISVFSIQVKLFSSEINHPSFTFSPSVKSLPSQLVSSLTHSIPSEEDSWCLQDKKLNYTQEPWIASKRSSQTRDPVLSSRDAVQTSSEELEVLLCSLSTTSSKVCSEVCEYELS